MSEENKNNPQMPEESVENSENTEAQAEQIGQIEETEKTDNAEQASNENSGVKHSRDGQTPKRVRLSTLVCSCIVLCLAAVMLTYTICNNAYKVKLANITVDNATTGVPADDSKYSELAILDEIFKNYTFEELDDEQIKIQLLKAYVYATGDKYAEYYTIDEYREMVNSSMLGNSVGIGVKVVEGNIVVSGTAYKVMKVVDVVKDSPAHKAGVLAGDCVVAIGTPEDNVTLNVLGYDAALNKLRGEKGTTALFAVYRPQDKNYELKYFNIIRDEYVDYSVTYKMVDPDVDPTGKTGIIKINSFNHTTPDQFDEAIEALKAVGCERFIFDVRDNPGGELTSIVAVLSRFLDEGKLLITTKDNADNSSSISVGVVEDDLNNEVDCPVTSQDIGKYKGLNCVVLCNEYTASAAELFVANFRDHNLAQVVGVTTYGKGTVQRYMSLQYYGISGILKMTIFKYFPPCGEGYDGIGIEPHIVVELSDEARQYNSYEIMGKSVDNQLVEAVKYFK